MKRANIILSCVICSVLFLTGCNGGKQSELTEVPFNEYERAVYNTEVVQKGDIEPVITLFLSAGAVGKIDYRINDPILNLEELNVEVGDTVKKGQVLAKFESEEVEKEVKQYREDYEKKQLMLEHLKNKAAMDKKENQKDYELQIQRMTDDIALSKIYLDEAEYTLSQRTIVAEADGTISFISKQMLAGYGISKTSLIMESYGDGFFYADTKDDYEFKIGDVYTAENSMVKLDMMLTEIIEKEDGKRTLNFSLVNPEENDNSGDTFTMNIKKASLKNVVYVSKEAINEIDDNTFVYVVNEKGFREPVFVQVSSYVDDYAIISQGLEGGEEVTVQ